MSFLRPLSSRIIASATALAVLLGSMAVSTAPAKADVNDVAKVIAGVAALAIVADAIKADDNNKHDRRHAAPPPPRHKQHYYAPPAPRHVYRAPPPPRHHAQRPQPPRQAWNNGRPGRPGPQWNNGRNNPPRVIGDRRYDNRDWRR